MGGAAEDDSDSVSKKQGTEETHSSQHSSQDDELAQEIGLNAHKYLEKCFYNEVSVLDQDKFNAIPEIVKSDLTILRHLGKGSFSDVFEVVYDSPLGEETADDFPGDQQGVENFPNHTPGGDLNCRSSDALDGPPGRRPSRKANPMSGSLCSRTLVKPSQLGRTRRILAMKCLKPAIRSDADEFKIGSEDLVHETAILANLSHRHVIQLHGRAEGHLTDAFVLNDGYFILLDKLDCTLVDRFEEWRDDGGVARGPNEKQLQIAHDVADAMVYLHSKKIVFRDLKPDNVGFDGRGVLKLFDFGFAIGLPEPTEKNPNSLMFDQCGTPRYMAPEVGLSQGYGLASDVYSFGILLWEIGALATPFAAIKSEAEFDQKVFKGGMRPWVGHNWPRPAKALIRDCWGPQPGKRPHILEVRASLAAMVCDGGGGGKKKSVLKTLRSSMRKSMTRRLSM